MKRKRIASALLAMAMVLSLVTVPAFAEEPEAGNWYDEAMTTWADYGIIKGDANGDLLPEAQITRGELAVILDRLMDYQVTGKNTFTDVVVGEWYASAILAANAAGIVKGDGTTARPLDKITREEAAVMFARVLSLSGEGGASAGYTDEAQISSWAVDAVKSMTAKGYMKGSDGALRPKDPITRAEVMTILSNVFQAYYHEAGTYTEDVAGTAVVSVGGVTLKDMKVSGDLILAEGVADGTINLDGVTVAGKLIVRGGGEHSIIIKGRSVIGEVIVARQEGKVRVSVQGNAKVDVVVIDDGSDAVKVEGAVETLTIEGPGSKVEITGDVKNVTMSENAAGATLDVGKDAKVTTLTAAAEGAAVAVAGTVTNVNVSEGAKDATLDVAKTAKVTTLTTAAEGAKVAVAGTVTNVTVAEGAKDTTLEVAKGAAVSTVETAGDGTAITGDGAVKNVTVTGGEGTKIETPGTKVENKGESSVTVGDKEIASGETGKAEGNVPSTGGGSSSGGNNTPSVTYKYNVTVGSVTGGTVTTDLDGNHTNDANKEVTLTVTANEGWKLKELTLTAPAESNAKIENNKFTMDKEGTYTVNATFVQPLTKMEAFIVNDAASISKMVEYEYTATTDPDILKDYPWLFIGVRKSGDAVGPVKISSITFNGSEVSAPSGWSSGFNKHAMAYVNVTTAEDSTGEALGFTGAAATVVVTVTCDDVTYTASCEYKAPNAGTIYTVSFNSNGGSAVSPQKIEENGKANKPADPTKTGYTFESWHVGSADGTAWTFDSDTVTGDTTLYAKWAPKTYNITYTLNDGKFTSDNHPTKYTIETDTITLPTDMTKDGYTFAGWYTDEAFTEANKVTQIVKGSTEDKNFWAKWTAVPVTTIAALEAQLEDASLTEVTLGGNLEIDKAVEIPEGKTLIVPTGKTLTTAGAGTITNKGTIVVNDAVSLNTAVNAGGLVQLGSSVETVDGIDLITKATSTLDLNGQAITTASGLNFHTIAVRDGGNLTIQDTKGTGSVSGTAKQDGNAVLAAYPGATLTVKGGKFTMATTPKGNRVVQNSGTMIIDGGTFEMTGTSNMSVIYCFNSGTVTINKGVIETGNNMVIFVNDVDSTDEEINGSTKVTMTGGEIKNDDATAVGVANGAVFEMTGGKITSTDSGADAVGAGSKFILSNGTVDAAKHGISVYKKGEFEMNGGTINSEGHAINGGNATDQSDVGYKITISGGTATSKDTGMYLPVGGTVNISNNAVVHGDNIGISIRGGALNISGGTVSANAARNETGSSANGQSGTLTGAIVLGQPNENYPAEITVTITGGTIQNGLGDKIVLDLGYQQNTWTVTGYDELVIKDSKGWNTSKDTSFPISNP